MARDRDMKVYTRKGDDGTTQLLFAGRERVEKSSLRVNAYGEMDEAVAALGVARADANDAGEAEVAALLLRLQRELFVLNAELATPPERSDRLEAGVTLVTGQMVEALESDIDALTGAFEQPKDFIVPGNTRLGASLDLAARVVRRGERAIDALARGSHGDPDEGSEVRPEARRYVNRLADLVWVMARYAERADRQPRPRSE
jgi:cob(I)alamin adenosyltransferase